ncbi:hypothetical protein KC335_g181 [Hortaea werneckii]|nr:hypothetical protein KC335_g181 [Hortaea werneckii]
MRRFRLNAYSCFSVYTNLVSFFVRLVSRIASLECRLFLDRLIRFPFCRIYTSRYVVLGFLDKSRNTSVPIRIT